MSNTGKRSFDPFSFLCHTFNTVGLRSSILYKSNMANCTTCLSKETLRGLLPTMGIYFVQGTLVISAHFVIFGAIIRHRVMRIIKKEYIIVGGSFHVRQFKVGLTSWYEFSNLNNWMCVHARAHIVYLLLLPDAEAVLVICDYHENISMTGHTHTLQIYKKIVWLSVR